MNIKRKYLGWLLIAFSIGIVIYGGLTYMNLVGGFN